MDYKKLTREQRLELADAMAADFLPLVNSMLEDVEPRVSLYSRYGKRAIDILLSGIALLVTLPINLFLGIATFIDVGAPILFKQKRAGKDGEIFVLIKFRNMRNTKDERGELLPPDKRVTQFGRLVRKTSLDELLNFWSIFKGDMSIIGPRPLPPENTRRYNKRHRMRLAVKPGLECPPRVQDGHVWSWQEQFDNDVWYVENLSFKTDCIMFLNLLRFMLDHNNTEARSKGSAVERGIFTGYNLEGKAVTLEEIPQEYIDRVLGEK